MPNPQNIEGQGFHTNPERINKTGRPRKWTTTLKEQGYKVAEINDSIQVMISMTEGELEDIRSDESRPIMERIVSAALLKSLGTKSLFNIETLFTRVFGKPKETLDANVKNDVKITMNLNEPDE